MKLHFVINILPILQLVEPLLLPEKSTVLKSLDKIVQYNIIQ